MQIEKAEYLNKRSNLRRSFSFKPDKLNLLALEEDDEKSDLFESICELIWGPKQELHNGDGNLSEACLVFQADGKTYELSRDFASNTSELKAAGSAIASQDKLFSGITKEIFSSLFLVGEGSGAANLADKEMRLNLLGQFATLSEHSSDIDKAIKLIEEKIEKYPFRDKNYKIDDLISGLSRGKLILQERLTQLERERQETAIRIDELKAAQDDLSNIQRRQKREEYFQLCLETAELDARIMKVHQRLLYEAELKRDLMSLGDLASFPISGVRKVQELHTMRQARLSDLERLQEDINSGNRENDLLLETLSKESEGLDEFSIEDAQQIYGLAGNLELALEELEQLQANRTQEMRRLKDGGVDFDAISLVRKSLLLLAPADLEEANQLAQEFKWHKDKLANLMPLNENIGNKLEIVNKEISTLTTQSRKMRNVTIGICVFSAIMTIVSFVVPQLKALDALATIFTTSFVLSVAATVLLTPLLSNMRKELQAKLGDIQDERTKSESTENELNTSLNKIQSRADELSKKYKFNSSADLFKKIQSYSNVSARLKQLDVLDQMIISREQQIENINKEAMSFFQRAKQSLLKVTPVALRSLASEILRHKENLREVERSTVVVNHRISERRFLEGEITDLDSVLRDFFNRARIEDPESIDQAYAEFEQKAQDYKKWESISQELKRLETDVTSDILEHDLATVLNKLQHKRTDAWTEMQDLISLYPDILSETIEDSELGRLGQSEEASIDDVLLEKQTIVNTLQSSIRTAARNFDEFHPKTQHELEVLERDLDMLKRNKNALVLAREALSRVAQESKSSWSLELAEIAAEMLHDSQLELLKIEWNENMELMLTLRNHEQAIHENELRKSASRGLLKQLGWIIRMIMCRYIAKRMPLPIVLDEPFSDLDDKRYAGCMDLLLQKVLPHCQVIILTCQPVRHQWFCQQLNASAGEKVLFAKAVPN